MHSSLIESGFYKQKPYELKDANRVEPVAATERKIDKNLEKKLIFPWNPTFQMDEENHK